MEMLPALLAIVPDPLQPVMFEARLRSPGGSRVRKVRIWLEFSWMERRLAIMDSRPNILFLFPDQLRWDYVGYAWKAPVRTPFLEQLAREGVRFDHAVVPSPVCAPCRRMPMVTTGWAAMP